MQDKLLTMVKACQIFALTLRGLKNTSDRFQMTIYDWQAIIKPVVMFNPLPFSETCHNPFLCSS